MNLKKLEQKGALQILLYILENEEAYINQMGRDLDVSVKTMRLKTLPLLRDELSLVKLIKSRKFPWSHVYVLTETGLKLAKCIKKLDS